MPPSHHSTDVEEKQAQLELQVKPQTFYCGLFCATPEVKHTSAGTLLYSLFPFLAVHVDITYTSSFTVLLTAQFQHVCDPKGKGLLDVFSSRS